MSNSVGRARCPQRAWARMRRAGDSAPYLDGSRIRLAPGVFKRCAGLLGLVVFLLGGVLEVSALSAAEADAAFDSFNSAFYVVSSGRGYYKRDTAGGRADFWKQAEMIEMIIDAYERSGRSDYRTMISQSIDGFLYYQGSDWLWNIYNDDIMWMIIASCRGYRATGNTTYRDRAKYHFDAVYARGCDSVLGGGIWWTTDKGSKNACINGPAAIAACMLYDIYGDSAYLLKAQQIYAWEKAVLFDTNTGKVYDNISSSGVVNSSWIFTYNQGTFIGAANYLRKLTGDATYYNDALKAALYTKNSLCTTEILPGYDYTGDGGGFTGIFARWMSRFMTDNHLENTFYLWMAGNANAAWTVRRSDNLSWSNWRSLTPAGTLPSFGCSTSVAMMQAVPTDYGLPGLIYNPVPLTSGSYNRDMIVEKTAPPPPTAGAYTTASMDQGTGNTGTSWYEVGYNTAAPTTGLPAAGSTFTHATYANHQYRMAPSYTANNAVLVNSSITSASLRASSPAAWSALSVLLSAGHGPGSVLAIVNHADGVSETNTLTVADWYNGANPAFIANGRVNVQTFAFDTVGGNNPRIYSADVTLAEVASAVTNVVFAYVSGGDLCILALSGSTGGAFTPITVAGYTHDMIVEAGAAKFGALPGTTTATMDGGTANTGLAWYEAGYIPFAPNTGLPPAGATYTNFFYPDHRYVFAPSYASNNAISLSSSVPTAVLVPATPAAFSALSFLSASCRGPVTLGCVLRHSDGTAESRSVVSPDWLNQAPSAVVANGRVNVSNGSYDSLVANNPRLYSLDIPVANTVSPITSIALTFSGGGSTANAAVFAVSGIPGTVAPIITRQPQSLKCWEGSATSLSASVAATAPLSCRWQKNTGGAYVDLLDSSIVSGAATTNLVLSPVSLAQAGDYRLVASNPGGAITSAVTTVTVMSALPDLAQPGDVITSFGGSSPTGEEVTNAIDHTTSKYLNFGVNGGAGNFVGPVGFVVTPSMGLSVARALRFYTANDFPGRDPSAYALYGSGDGGLSWTLITSGALNLPNDRNAPGLALDPISQAVQQVTFTNLRAVTSYKVSFTGIKTNSASMMQIGEVEILGSPVFSVSFQPGSAPGTLTLRSALPGHLWSTAALEGADTVWVEEGPIVGDLTITVDASTPARFFRVSVP